MGQYYVIIPVFNRKSTTLRCLETLKDNGDFANAKVVVVDDASTDGTAGAVAEFFPSVTMLHGNGSLWWGGGISLGMNWALSQSDCTGVVWLNDDCRPTQRVLKELIAYSKSNQAVATAQAATPGGFVYGGHLKAVFGLRPVQAPDGVTLSADACNGNCVAFPRSILDKVGAFSHREFPQNFGDGDYTLRATRLGFRLVVLGGLSCDNDQNLNLSHSRWTDRSISIRSFVSTWRSQRSLLYPPARFRFYLRHWGPWGLVLAILPYFRFAMVILLRPFMRKQPGPPHIPFR